MVVLFSGNVAIGHFLGMANPGLFTVTDMAILSGLTLHLLNVSLLAFQLADFLPGQVSLVDALVNAVVLTNLGLTDGLRTVLRGGCNP